MTEPAVRDHGGAVGSGGPRGAPTTAEAPGEHSQAAAQHLQQVGPQPNQADLQQQGQLGAGVGPGRERGPDHRPGDARGEPIANGGAAAPPAEARGDERRGKVQLPSPSASHSARAQGDGGREREHGGWPDAGERARDDGAAGVLRGGAQLGGAHEQSAPRHLLQQQQLQRWRATDRGQRGDAPLRAALCDAQARGHGREVLGDLRNAGEPTGRRGGAVEPARPQMQQQQQQGEGRTGGEATPGSAFIDYTGGIGKATFIMRELRGALNPGGERGAQPGATDGTDEPVGSHPAQLRPPRHTDHLPPPAPPSHPPPQPPASLPAHDARDGPPTEAEPRGALESRAPCDPCDTRVDSRCDGGLREGEEEEGDDAPPARLAAPVPAAPRLKGGAGVRVRDRDKENERRTDDLMRTSGDTQAVSHHRAQAPNYRTWAR